MRTRIIFSIILLLSAPTMQNVFAQHLSVSATKEKSNKEERSVKEEIVRFDKALTGENIKDLDILVADDLFMKHSNGLVETKKDAIGAYRKRLFEI